LLISEVLILKIEFKSVKIEHKVDREKRIIKGYATIFDTLDLYGDTIVRGAFADDIEEHGEKRLMFYNHNPRGDTPPIGHTTVLREDSKGLYYEGYLSKTERASEILELIADTTVEKSSIGYYPLAVEWPDDDEKAEYQRKLLKIKLVEISPVDFPANEEATVELARANFDRWNNERRAAALVADIQAFTRKLRGE
jgi:HK97 family phage prohead protease